MNEVIWKHDLVGGSLLGRLSCGKATVSVKIEGDEFFTLDFTGTTGWQNWSKLGLSLGSTARAIRQGKYFSEAFAAGEFVPGGFGGNDVYAEATVLRKRVHVEFQEKDTEYPEELRIKANPYGITVGGHAATGPDGMEAIGAILFNLHKIENKPLGIISHEDLLASVILTLRYCDPLPKEEEEDDY